MEGKIILNVSQIKDKLGRFSAPKAQSLGRRKAETITQQRKQRFLNIFQNHEITKEIAGGSSGQGSLGVTGNLFSFIGFAGGSDPTDDLYNYLQESIGLSNAAGIFDLSSKTIRFKMDLPSNNGIKSVTDMSNYTDDWAAGKSWVSMIEHGIPGLNKYKYSENPSELGGDSRSGTGLQRSNQIRSASYKARKYLTEMLKILIKSENR